MNLKVEQIPERDTWKDVVRIPYEHRYTLNGIRVRRGAVCKLIVNRRSKLVTVHGCPLRGARIQIDSKLRTDLGLDQGCSYEFELRLISWTGYWRWAWTASDPAYRVPAQMSLISLVLGLIGLLLGLISIWPTLK
jgi:hypothetical protein